MKKLPCEKAIWETIPCIRKKIACTMIYDYGLTQKKAAELLNITPAAISQYKCNKRADIEITDPIILKEIKISTKLIIEKGNTVLEQELCRICKLISKNNSCTI
jgi:predicted transcriptional regulator